MNKTKSSKLSLKDLNTNKSAKLSSFIQDYQQAVQFYIDYLWNNKIIFKDKILDIKNDLLDCPMFISTKNIKYDSSLSARALSVACTQACSIISSSLEKRKRKLYIKDRLKSEGKRTRRINKLIEKEVLVKPNPKDIYPELNSLNVKIEQSHIKHFDIIITLSSLGKGYGKIIIPVKNTSHSKKLEQIGTSLNSIMLTPTYISLRYEYETNKKEQGKIVGADTGINSVVTLSDSQVTPPDLHGHTLNSILNKISRKKKGSKSFHKALKHRDNYINWSVNQLNLDDIKQINLEKVTDFRYKKNVGKFLNYSGEALIRSKLIDYAEDHDVHVKLQESAYRSQRCSHCGYVCKTNRKGKMFSCKHCLFQSDADLNASLNHEQNLPSANWILYHSDRKNIKFIWKSDGFYNLDGSELIVSGTKKR